MRKMRSKLIELFKHIAGLLGCIVLLAILGTIASWRLPTKGELVVVCIAIVLACGYLMYYVFVTQEQLERAGNFLVRRNTMNNDYNYRWEKLYNAVLCLTDAGDQRTRLDNAIRTLNVLRVRPQDKYLPDEIQTEFIEFMKEMTSVEVNGDEGTITATVNSLDEMGIRCAIEKIIHFYDTICHHEETLLPKIRETKNQKVE